MKHVKAQIVEDQISQSTREGGGESLESSTFPKFDAAIMMKELSNEQLPDYLQIQPRKFTFHPKSSKTVQ
eukprot:g1785.t1